jgi:hypothetical protein
MLDSLIAVGGIFSGWLAAVRPLWPFVVLPGNVCWPLETKRQPGETLSLFSATTIDMIL